MHVPAVIKLLYSLATLITSSRIIGRNYERAKEVYGDDGADNIELRRAYRSNYIALAIFHS